VLSNFADRASSHKPGPGALDAPSGVNARVGAERGNAAAQNPIDKPTMPSTCPTVFPLIETTQPPEQKNWPLELMRVR